MSVITVEDLTVRGTDETALVREVSLSIERGETVLLAGPSGSGKTLLGTAIAGLLANQPGLSVTGQQTRDGNVGLLMQNPRRQLVRERVRADVAFGLENQGLEPARIQDRIETWAEELSATGLLDRKIDSLSRGETTLVALLGALVTDPDLMVLDEPLAPLDDRNRRLVIDAIEALQSETALLVAEHDATGLLSSVDRVVLLEAGRIDASGPPREVLQPLSDAGVKLPFATDVALAQGKSPDSVPITEE